MLRPEQMSKVSVTGSKAVMEQVIEAVHELNLVHLSDYDGSWEGFDNGDPIEGSDEVSEKLVTVRSLESILDIDEQHAGPSRILDDEELEAELEAIREEVNALDDERNEVRDELREVNEKLDNVEPFADLGIDLHLLSGYDSLVVQVGEGDQEEIDAALAAADDVEAFETFAGEEIVAAFVYPAGDAGEDAVNDALVGVEFTQIEVPEGEGSPEEYVEELRHRRQRLESRLDSIDSEIEEIKLESAGFLLAAEEKLTIEAQRADAPLQFATTQRSFVAEGWIPTDRYDDLVAQLRDAVGDRVEIEELERADYDEDGHAVDTEEVEPGEPEEPEAPDEADEGEREAPVEAVTDGGHATPGRAASGGIVTMADEPPVIQDNIKSAQPFEFLLKMINRPKYTELDPTIVLLLTFPFFFGFMLGDLGYGLLYMGAGYLLYSRFDDEVFQSLGAIGLWAGGFTALFGVLYGELLGMHFLGEIVWHDIVGWDGPPMHKGLQPAYLYYGQAWLFASVLLGLLHLTVGYVFGFINDLDHGVGKSFLEHGSWATLMFGVWIWILSRHGSGVKPEFLYTSFGGEHPALPLGFTGLPEAVGIYVGGGLLVVGLLTVIYGEVQHFGVMGILVGGLESFSVFGDVLSYLRIGAVILAKAGMAFVVNLLVFGVYVTGEESEAEWHFATGHMPEVGATEHGHEVTEIMFGGLLHGGVVSILAAVFIFVIGHILVLLLGLTSAGLQGIRLEYVEFFDKFYEGGGKKFSPFGKERRFTTDD